MKVLMIIPAYNEQDSILNTYRSIYEYNKSHTNKKLDVIVINDGSKDKTEDILQENGIPHIHLVHNLGIGGAVQTGYKYAFENGYDIAVQFDGDGQHDVNYVRNICEPIEEGRADFVIGSRFVEEKDGNFRSSAARRIGIKLISFFIKLTTGHVVKDTTSGFRAVGKEVIKEFAREYPTEYPEPITTTVLLRKGYKMKEVSVLMHEREAGNSSISSFKSAYYMINVIMNILLVRMRRYPR